MSMFMTPHVPLPTMSPPLAPRAMREIPTKSDGAPLPPGILMPDVSALSMAAGMTPRRHTLRPRTFFADATTSPRVRADRISHARDTPDDIMEKRTALSNVATSQTEQRFAPPRRTPIRQVRVDALPQARPASFSVAVRHANRNRSFNAMGAGDANNLSNTSNARFDRRTFANSKLPSSGTIRPGSAMRGGSSTGAFANATFCHDGPAPEPKRQRATMGINGTGRSSFSDILAATRSRRAASGNAFARSSASMPKIPSAAAPKRQSSDFLWSLVGQKESTRRSGSRASLSRCSGSIGNMPHSLSASSSIQSLTRCG